MPFKKLESKGTNRELIMDEDFQALINENPSVIKIFTDFVKECTETNSSVDKFESKDISIFVNSKFMGKPSTFHVIVGDNHFFIKTVPGYRSLDNLAMGADEFKSLEEAKILLTDEPNVRVADFMLGYQDKGRTYFVSKWEEGTVNLRYYLSTILNSNGQKWWELRNRVDRIKKLLPDFLDVWENNMLYNENTNEIIIFDIHKKKNI